MKTKRIISALLVMLMCISMMAFAGCGKKKTETVKVYVTLSDAGELAGVYKEVEAEDTDGDGVISTSDAIACGNKAISGNADDYAAVNTEFGIMITKLLGGENGGSYGCYVNNTFATSLADAVKEGDHVYAFSYKDLTAWSDAYSYFDKTTVKADGEITLKLSYIAFDESYNPVETPAAGAVITVDGKETDVVTGEDGTAVITVEGAGEHIISAVSDTMTLVPPVCVVTVG